MEDIHGTKADMFGKVDVSKKDTKGKDEESRKKIAKDMEDIYSQTKTNVEKILTDLEKRLLMILIPQQILRMQYLKNESMTG
jgi:hypothetical protein